MGGCGKLNFWLYGFRPAAAAWEEHYSEKLGRVGFERGVASLVVFHHPARDISCVGHGDDFTSEWEDSGLKWILSEMQKWFEVKLRGNLGPEVGDDKEVTILGRIVKRRSCGIEYQADPRHRKLVNF